jgi:hypothetical protein
MKLYLKIIMSLKSKIRSGAKHNKPKLNKYHSVGTIPKSNIKIERGKIDTTNTQKHYN